MTDCAMLDGAAAKLDAISRMRPGSPLARMVEQGEQFAKIMPKPRDETRWEPTQETRPRSLAARPNV